MAEIGSGGGYALIQMAKSYPNSTFIGYDLDGPSVERARRLAESQGVSGNLKFEVGDSTGYPSDDYDLVLFPRPFRTMRRSSFLDVSGPHRTSLLSSLS